MDWNCGSILIVPSSRFLVAVNIRVGLVDSYVYYCGLSNSSQQIKIVISYGRKRANFPHLIDNRLTVYDVALVGKNVLELYINYDSGYIHSGCVKKRNILGFNSSI